MKITDIVNQSTSKAGRWFDLFIQFLILLSLISFTMETLPDLQPRVIHVLRMLEVITVILFSLEYLLRIIAAERIWGYVFSFYGIIDLLAILPFYLGTGIDLRSIRVFRLIRLLRVFKLFKYSRAVERLRLAFQEVKVEFCIFIIAAGFVLYISAVGIYYFEHDAQPEVFKSIFHCLWWAVATLTTVGYGDIYPVTVGGKIFTSLIVLVGLGIVAVPTGLIAASLSRTIRDDDQEE